MIVKILLVLFLFNYNNAWWETGHMLTAQVAELELMEKNITIYNLYQHYI